jgi:Nuclease-related domain
MNDSSLGGRAGASARRQYERRREARRARVLARHPRFGKLLLAFAGAPAHEESWRRGAEGEEHTARRLNALLDGRGIVLVHDRRMPGSQANIDHLTVGPGGVTVIDTKWLRGKVRVRRERGLFSGSHERLMVGGRDRTKLVEGVRRQVAVVSELLGDGVGVVGAMCFVDSDGLPLFSKPKLGGVRIAGPRGVARLARRNGSLSPSEVQEIAERLRTVLPEA